MKLGVSSEASHEKCNGSSGSSFMTVRFASCSSRRKRETRSAVMLKADGTYERGGPVAVAFEIVTYGLVKEVR